MSLIIRRATILDAVAEHPIEGRAVVIEGARIKAIVPESEVRASPDALILDVRGKYLLPGLMNANVHLVCGIGVEMLARYVDHYERLVVEAAQLSLRNGVTTVFDTWGPRRYLMSVRDRVREGRLVGSRIFCSGNIVGLDGPLSQDFFLPANAASDALTQRINAIWVENVGRHLMWLPAELVAEEVRKYIGRGVDFLKYASNGHGGAFGSAFLAFSPKVQAAIVAEARDAGLTVQAHATTVEGLEMAIEAGCDLIQHVNMTGPAEIPASTLALLASRKTGTVVFPFTQRRLEMIAKEGSAADRTLWGASDANARKLIACGAPLLLATDGFVWPEAMAREPLLNRAHLSPGDDNLFDITTGHFAWLRAMEEKGCAPMAMLRAATRNIAVAYGVDKDLGSVEAGKFADLLVLDADPLAAAANYRRIHAIVKDGRVVDAQALPEDPVLMRPAEILEEERAYIPFLRPSASFPLCPTCVGGWGSSPYRS